MIVRCSSQKQCKTEAENSRQFITEEFSPALAYHSSNFIYLCADWRNLST